jgi:hypothetical protein
MNPWLIVILSYSFSHWRWCVRLARIQTHWHTVCFRRQFGTTITITIKFVLLSRARSHDGTKQWPPKKPGSVSLEFTQSFWTGIPQFGASKSEILTHVTNDALQFDLDFGLKYISTNQIKEPVFSKAQLFTDPTHCASRPWFGLLQ